MNVCADRHCSMNVVEAQDDDLVDLANSQDEWPCQFDLKMQKHM
jgi:hypothetical protein